MIGAIPGDMFEAPYEFDRYPKIKGMLAMLEWFDDLVRERSAL